MINADPNMSDIWSEENTHVWQSRAMGELFLPSYFYNSSSAFSGGRNYYSDNWWEIQAQDDPF